MSRANPDIARLKLDEIPEVRTEDLSSTPNHLEKGENIPNGAAAPSSPQDRIRNSSLAPRYAQLRSPRHESPTSSGPSSPNPSQSTSPPANSTLKSNGSSASVSSQFSHKSLNNGLEKPKLTPANSVLELKRFFGKGRTKHEHGVKIKPPTEKKKPLQAFNLFGLGKKKGSSATSSPQHTAPPSPASSIFHSKHHHNHDSLGDNHNKGFFKSEKPTPPLENGGPPYLVKGKPPADLDPLFIVHGPDYEAEWDPFHIFGLDPNSERLPFLESGITKYGEVGRDMGSGAGGSVRMMERPSDNKLFAVKEFRARRANETPQKYAKHMTAEYALGAALHHKNIIETIDLIKEGDKYYEVMEYGPHDFFEIVMSGSMNTPQINSSFRQIMNGVAYLHSMGVAHRDLKLDNCVVDDQGVVKLIDFGSAVIFKYPMSSHIHLARGILGSDPYLAPEVFLKQPYQPQCADVWSCGIIYCCTYLRRFPWKIPQSEDTSFRKFSENPGNIDGKHPAQENPRKITGPWRLLRLLPRDSRQLVISILKIDVKTRATVDDILADPWFSQIQEISVLPAPLPEKK